MKRKRRGIKEEGKGKKNEWERVAREKRKGEGKRKEGEERKNGRMGKLAKGKKYPNS